MGKKNSSCAASVSTCWLKIADVRGSYTIPHIRTAREIVFSVPFADAAPTQAWVTLVLNERVVAPAILPATGLSDNVASFPSSTVEAV